MLPCCWVQFWFLTQKLGNEQSWSYIHCIVIIIYLHLYSFIAKLRSRLFCRQGNSYCTMDDKFILALILKLPSETVIWKLIYCHIGERKCIINNLQIYKTFSCYFYLIYFFLKYKWGIFVIEFWHILARHSSMQDYCKLVTL